jgi:hypothetical protein
MQTTIAKNRASSRIEECCGFDASNENRLIVAREALGGGSFGARELDFAQIEPRFTDGMAGFALATDSVLTAIRRTF